jgi:hypothetical protein
MGSGRRSFGSYTHHIAMTASFFFDVLIKNGSSL